MGLKGLTLLTLRFKKLQRAERGKLKSSISEQGKNRQGCWDPGGVLRKMQKSVFNWDKLVIFHCTK